MADEPDVSKPAEPPKPVHIGGESLADRLLPHLKKIMIGAVIIAVILSGYYGYRAFKQSKMEKETAKLASVLTVAQRDVAIPGVPEDPALPPFPTTKERATAILDELAKQGTDKAGPVYKAGLLIDAGRYDDAITELKKCEKAKALEGVLCRETLGIALETKGFVVHKDDAAARQQLLDQALATFTAMQPDEKGPRYVYAIYHQGRIKAAIGKIDEAKALLKKAKELAPIEPPRRSMLEPPTFAELVDHRLANLGG